MNASFDLRNMLSTCFQFSTMSYVTLSMRRTLPLFILCNDHLFA